MYLHSWEFDPQQPRVGVPGLGSRFRHYNNLARTLPRMRRLLGMLESMGARFVTMSEFVDGVRETAPALPHASFVGVATDLNGRCSR